jgi:hypothetical protein
MGTLTKRVHENGWIAIVDEEAGGDTLTAYAVRPGGEPIYPPMNQYQGDESDYQDRKQRAQARADYAIVMVTGGHAKCNCPPWPKGGA